MIGLLHHSLSLSLTHWAWLTFIQLSLMTQLRWHSELCNQRIPRLTRHNLNSKNVTSFFFKILHGNRFLTLVKINSWTRYWQVFLVKARIKPLIIAVIGMVPNSLTEQLQDFGVKSYLLQSMQKSVVIRTSSIVRSFLNID